jgi:hypothetical protein
MATRDYFEIQHGEALVEVCCCKPGPMDGALLGYAIRFSGGWDGWKVQHPDHRTMTKVAINRPLPAAVAAITETGNYAHGSTKEA